MHQLCPGEEPRVLLPWAHSSHQPGPPSPQRASSLFLPLPCCFAREVGWLEAVSLADNHNLSPPGTMQHDY